MKINPIRSTILLIFLTTSQIFAQAQDYIKVSRTRAQVIKTQIETLEKKTNAQADVIAAQAEMIVMLIEQTNRIMAMALNRIDFSGAVLERSEVHREIVKIEKKKSFRIGLGIGAAAGAGAVILLIKGIKAIRESTEYRPALLNTLNLKPGAARSYAGPGIQLFTCKSF